MGRDFDIHPRVLCFGFLVMEGSIRWLVRPTKISRGRKKGAIPGLESKAGRVPFRNPNENALRPC